VVCREDPRQRISTVGSLNHVVLRGNIVR
jgi:hypothetical protein